MFQRFSAIPNRITTCHCITPNHLTTEKSFDLLSENRANLRLQPSVIQYSHIARSHCKNCHRLCCVDIKIIRNDEHAWEIIVEEAFSVQYRASLIQANRW